MPEEVWEFITTAPDQDLAHRLAQGAVAAGLAACAQTEGPIHSFYRWQGALESTREFRVVFKTSDASREPLARWIHQQHPYETPQWVGWPLHASAAYADWVRPGPPTPPSQNHA